MKKILGQKIKNRDGGRNNNNNNIKGPRLR